MECPFCKSDNIISGYLMGAYKIRFISNNDRHFAKDTYPVDIYVCKECGSVVRIKVKNPEKL